MTHIPGSKGWSKDIWCCMGIIPKAFLLSCTASCCVGAAPRLLTFGGKKKNITKRTNKIHKHTNTPKKKNITISAGHEGLCAYLYTWFLFRDSFGWPQLLLLLLLLSLLLFCLFVCTVSAIKSALQREIGNSVKFLNLQFHDLVRACAWSTLLLLFLLSVQNNKQTKIAENQILRRLIRSTYYKYCQSCESKPVCLITAFVVVVLRVCIEDWKKNDVGNKPVGKGGGTLKKTQMSA